MPTIHVVGIDPGLVHTGVVSLVFDTTFQTINIDSIAIDGPDAQLAADWIDDRSTSHRPRHVFIEKYVPRQRYGTDERMVKAETEFKLAIPSAKLIRNTGSQKIVTTGTMRVLGVWSFSTLTHHQDLRAAARIMVYGMMKSEQLNPLLAAVIRSALDGDPWLLREGKP